MFRASDLETATPEPEPESLTRRFWRGLHAKVLDPFWSRGERERLLVTPTLLTLLVLFYIQPGAPQPLVVGKAPTTVWGYINYVAVADPSSFWPVVWIWEIACLGAVLEGIYGSTRVLLLFIIGSLSGVAWVGAFASPGTVISGSSALSTGFVGAWVADLVLAPAKANLVNLRILSVFTTIFFVTVNIVATGDTWSSVSNIGTWITCLCLGFVLFPISRDGSDRHSEHRLVRLLVRVPLKLIRWCSGIYMFVFLFAWVPAVVVTKFVR